LEVATTAYQAALRRRDDAHAELARARADVPVTRQRLARAIVAAYVNDYARVNDLARATGYGREQVRRILRAAGVDPD
jgi:hypothetical protein